MRTTSTRRTRGTAGTAVTSVRVAVAAAALALMGGCGANEREHGLGVGVADPGAVDLVPFAEVAVGDCIADSVATDGFAPVADCGVEGAVRCAP